MWLLWHRSSPGCLVFDSLKIHNQADEGAERSISVSVLNGASYPLVTDPQRSAELRGHKSIVFGVNGNHGISSELNFRAYVISSTLNWYQLAANCRHGRN